MGNSAKQESNFPRVPSLEADCSLVVVYSNLQALTSKKIGSRACPFAAQAPSSLCLTTHTPPARCCFYPEKHSADRRSEFPSRRQAQEESRSWGRRPSRDIPAPGECVLQRE